MIALSSLCSSLSGKSTLLDVLAGKKTAGHMEGEVLLNGKAFDARSFNHTAAYAEQFDSHSPFATVKEAISFSALLRLPSHITSQDGEVERRVMHVMDALDLQHSANDIIGAPGFGGVSPEVRKKVTIAVELVMDPALIFLDEPTTGLDSAGAFAVMSSVKKLAQEMAVICTIHQPSNEIVHMFDWLLLLQPGGQVVFFGPVKELVPFFVKNGIAQAPDDPDSPDLNVADFALDAIRSANAKKGKEGAVDMVKAFEESERCKQIQAELDKNTAGGNQQQQQQDDDGPQQAPDLEKGLALAEQNTSRNANVNANAPSAPAGGSAAGANEEDDHQYPGFVFQLYLLTQRNIRSTWRNRLTFKTRYFTAVVLGFVCGTLFFRLDHSQEAASARVSVLFVATIIPMFLSSSSLADVFAVRPLYFREYTSRMYGAASWFLARRLADVPYYVIEVTIFGTMLYWIAGMRSSNDGGYFFWFLFTLFGVRATGSAFTQAVATAFASPEVAAAFQSTAFTIFFLFAGFLIPKPLIRNGWIWMYYLSFIRYPLDFLLGNEFASVTFDCSDYPVLADCPVPVGNTILDEFGVEYDLGHEAVNFIALWIFLAGFLFFGFLALRFINHIKR